MQKEDSMAQWTQQEQRLINWFHFYVAVRTHTKGFYGKWLDEIDKGPSNTRREGLIHELNTIKRLVEYGN